MNDLKHVTGRIFNIQGYSIHDGPGVRTTVFLSGCPLRCKWCQNPESHTPESKLFFLKEKCTGCAACLSMCPNQAISMHHGKAVTDRSLCNDCGKCVSVCLSGARELSGYDISAGDLMERILRDRIFFEGSNGGVTLSGGEVLAQPVFTAAVLALCKAENIHTAIETCGYGSWETLSRILEYTDLVLYDFKHMDTNAHKTGTGVGNELILENAGLIYNKARKPMAARVPVIPGFNDTYSNMEALAHFIVTKLGADVKVNLLPYHRLGESKNDRMENSANRFIACPPPAEHMRNLLTILESFGLEVFIGG